MIKVIDPSSCRDRGTSVQCEKRHLIRRSKFELYVDILKALSGCVRMKPTEIMYEVNICYQFLERYLDSLTKQDLIERKAINGQRTTYLITQKGLIALNKYLELKRNLSTAQEKESVPSSFCNEQV